MNNDLNSGGFVTVDEFKKAPQSLSTLSDTLQRVSNFKAFLMPWGWRADENEWSQSKVLIQHLCNSKKNCTVCPAKSGALIKSKKPNADILLVWTSALRISLLTI